MNYHGVTGVRALDGHRLLLQFDNGETRVFDANPIMSIGRFRELALPHVFSRVTVRFDTVEWENGLDLDPEYLYDRSQPATAAEVAKGDFATACHV